jgi:hypothetical protein
MINEELARDHLWQWWLDLKLRYVVNRLKNYDPYKGMEAKEAVIHWLDSQNISDITRVLFIKYGIYFADAIVFYVREQWDKDK